jgi:metal-responsive CopG/Arc/MetJ family transcriptional regulator
MPKQTTNRKSPRTGKQIVVYFPESVVDQIHALLPELDLDRSKFIRKAVRNELKRVQA